MSPNKFTYGHILNTERLFADVTAVGSTDRAERAILELILAVFLANSGHICKWSGSHFVM